MRSGQGSKIITCGRNVAWIFIGFRKEDRYVEGLKESYRVCAAQAILQKDPP